MGNTVLYYAVSNSHYETVELLLDLGVDVNAQNEFGNTCLHKAFMLGDNNNIIKLLINRQASLQALNNY